MKFSIKDFFSRCDQIRRKLRITFAEEILKGKLYFLFSVRNYKRTKGLLTLLGQTLRNIKHNKVKWVVKFVQKWNLRI